MVTHEARVLPLYPEKTDHSHYKKRILIRKNLVAWRKVALLVIYVERGSWHGLDYLYFDLAPGRILRAMTG